MDGHPLVELTYVLYGVRPTVIYGEGRLVEPPRKFSPLYLMCERRLGDSVQGFAHGVVYQAFVR